MTSSHSNLNKISYFSSCLIALVRPPKTVLNESKNLYLIPDLKDTSLDSVLFINVKLVSIWPLSYSLRNEHGV